MPKDFSFMDRRPSPRDIPPDIVSWLRSHHAEMVAAWNVHYPDNPAGRTEDE